MSVKPIVVNADDTNLTVTADTDRRHEKRLTNIVREILNRRSPGREIFPDYDLRETGLTSLDMVNLMLSVEAEFDIKIPDSEMTMRNFQSISAIKTLLASLLNQTIPNGDLQS